VFENSQGVLLDETYGDANNTYSTVTNRLAEDFAYTAHLGKVTKVGVCRTYLTRHGVGDFPEPKDIAYDDPFNRVGTYQGPLRKAYWNKPLFEYALQAVDGVDILAVNHTDVLNVPYFMPNVQIIGKGENRSDKTFYGKEIL
jgi:adenylosuccinate synthase